MIDLAGIYLAKAEESLVGAESEFANGRYNNCANRCYYACFQAAIGALIRSGVTPAGASGQWGHEFVQGEFARRLVNQRKLYPGAMSDTLIRNLELRQAADYRREQVTQTQADRVLRGARTFVDNVRARGTT